MFDKSIYTFDTPAWLLCMVPEQRMGLEQEIHRKQPSLAWDTYQKLQEEKPSLACTITKLQHNSSYEIDY